MGNFGIIKYCLKSICEIILAYAKARLLFVNQKNSAFGNNGTLMFTLIKNFGDKIAYWKNLIFFERDLIAVARIKAW
ncbi:MAG: hypothetical protein ACP5KK_03405 [Candidatus Nanoarchaeia archaeon]|jgi:hypothetical protein